MNIQAMMKQAQKLQKDMLNAKEEIDKTVFEGKSGLVCVEMTGNKKIQKVTIDSEELSKEDIEMLEDMIMIATNDAIAKIDQLTEQKLGQYTQGMPGLF